MLDTSSQDSTQGGARHYVDTEECPKWGIAGDGSRVLLACDAELQEEYAAWRDRACQHPQQFTGKILDTLGRPLFKRYCKGCGIATTSALPHRTVADTDIKPIDTAKRDGLVDQYVDLRRRELEEIANRAANRAQPNRRAAYADYLNSPEWRDLRDAVMERCGNLCEGCRKRDAADVHHITYKHIGCEFLFELVGLCRQCHARWHETDTAG